MKTKITKCLERTGIKQQQAIELLLLGKNQGEIAEAIGVSRETLSRWVNHDKDFQEAFRTLRSEMGRVGRRELRKILQKSVQIVTRQYLGLPLDIEPKRICLVCGKDRPSHCSKFCSEECRLGHMRIHGLPLSEGPFMRLCEVCNQRFMAGHPRAKYCETCRSEVFKARSQTYWAIRAIYQDFKSMAERDPVEAREIYNEMLSDEGPDFIELVLGDLPEKLLFGKEEKERT